MNIVLVCEVCKKEFKPYTANQKRCSRKCSSEHRRTFHKRVNALSGTLNNGTVGAIGELVASVDLMKKGYEVYRALSPSSKCDLIGIKDGVIHKFEVRTGSYIDSVDGLKLIWPTAKSEGKELLVVTFYDGKVHYIKNEGSSGKNPYFIKIPEDYFTQKVY